MQEHDEPEARSSAPRMSAGHLPRHIADLLLAGAGEQAATKHPATRFGWHLFLFSTVAFVAWHMFARLVIVPSALQNVTLLRGIRLFEAAAYGYLLVTVGVLTYRHYRYMLLPRLGTSIATLAFLFLVSICLFSRLYYSLFHFDQSLFSFADGMALPTAEFGLHGSRDMEAVGKFFIFSACSMLNSGHSNIQPVSILATSIVLVEVVAGYLFAAIVIATFVNIASDRKD